MRRQTAFERDFEDLHGPEVLIDVTPRAPRAAVWSDPMPGKSLAWRFAVAVAILCVCAVVALVALGLIGIGALAFIAATHA